MSIFKAYDIRGRVPGDLDEGIARRIGRAFAEFLRAKSLVVGRDMREHSPAIAAAAIEGIRDAGASVLDVGLASTPMAYHAIATLPCDGGLNTTASHNGAEWNGFKLCREGARALSRDTGIRDIERLVAGPSAPPRTRRGSVEPREWLARYADHVASFARGLRRLRVALDAGSGMAAHTMPAVLERLAQVEPTLLCFELDGRFPHHEANPLVERNLEGLKRAVRDEGCALGVAFDGDADRCVLVDERGETVPADLLTALLAREALLRRPGAAVVYDLRSSRVVPEEIARAGGRPVRERVGHSFIKETMRREEAVFGGELSGHYYFEENHYCDSGEVACVAALSLLGSDPTPLSKRIGALKRTAKTGEINFRVADTGAAMEEAVRAFSEGRVERFDGVTVSREGDAGEWWWFNLRPSNTEPLLRLNLEASNEEALARTLRRLEGALGKPEA